MALLAALLWTFCSPAIGGHVKLEVFDLTRLLFSRQVTTLSAPSGLQVSVNNQALWETARNQLRSGGFAEANDSEEVNDVQVLSIVQGR